jgi:hypothetical protein
MSSICQGSPMIWIKLKEQVVWQNKPAKRSSWHSKLKGLVRGLSGVQRWGHTFFKSQSIWIQAETGSLFPLQTFKRRTLQSPLSFVDCRRGGLWGTGSQCWYKSSSWVNIMVHFCQVLSTWLNSTQRTCKGLDSFKLTAQSRWPLM